MNPLSLSTYKRPAGSRSRHNLTQKGYNPPKPTSKPKGQAPHLAGKKEALK